MKTLTVQENDITYGAFTLSPTGMTTVGLPTFKEWMRCGDFIKKANKSVHFWIGDWLNFGEGAYGEDFSQAIDEMDYSYHTLQNDKWVAKRIPLASRRRELTFSHHQEVADLEPEEQRELLDMAVQHKMNTASFRKSVRHYKLKLDVPELDENQLKPADPLSFVKAQEVIDASIKTIEILEALDWGAMNVDARDYLISHLKRAGTMYFGLVRKYDRQKPLSETVV